MSNEGVIKRLRNIAILVTVIVLFLLVVLNPLGWVYPEELGFPLFITLFVSLPLYILWAIAKWRLKNNQRAAIRAAYLRACLAGTLTPFLIFAFGLYMIMTSEAGPIGGGFFFLLIVLASPLISGITMLAVFVLALR